MSLPRRTTRTVRALDRRNRAAARVRKIEEQLSAARQSLEKAEDAVAAAQQREQTTVHFGDDGWSLAGQPLTEVLSEGDSK